MAETPNYNLRYPVGTDPVDVAGDIANLASDVDGALGDVGGAGSIDVDADGRTDFGTTGPPLRLYGADRPDGLGDGDLLTAPAGTTYTYTGATPREEPIMGAHIWFQFSQSGTGWVVMYGATPAVVSPYVTSRTHWMEASQLQAGTYSYELVVKAIVSTNAFGDPPNMGWYYSSDTIGSDGNMAIGKANESNATGPAYWCFQPFSDTETALSMTKDSYTFYGLVAHYLRVPYGSATTWPTAVPADTYLAGSDEHLKALAADIKEVAEEVAADPDHPRYDDLQIMKDYLERLRQENNHG